MNNVLYLDSDSNIKIMRNKDYAECVWDTNSKMSAEMDGSITSTQQKYLIHNLINIWFSTNLIMNVFSFSNIDNGVIPLP